MAVALARLANYAIICPNPQSLYIPSGKRLHNYGKSQFVMGKSTISMAIFNSYVCLPEGKYK